jgi:hypothetical protein
VGEAVAAGTVVATAVGAVVATAVVGATLGAAAALPLVAAGVGAVVAVSPPLAPQATAPTPIAASVAPSTNCRRVIPLAGLPICGRIAVPPLARIPSRGTAMLIAAGWWGNDLVVGTHPGSEYWNSMKNR